MTLTQHERNANKLTRRKARHQAVAMAKRRRKLLILEDSPARIRRFERALQSELPDVQACIADNEAEMVRLIDSDIGQVFAISLDHDLHPAGIEDAGDGFQFATLLVGRTPECPVIIHTSNAEQGRRMHGVLDAGGWEIRLAGAIGEVWIEVDWWMEIGRAYNQNKVQD